MNPNIFSGNTEDAKTGREWLYGLLKENVVEIVFEKKDGSERVLKGTLKQNLIGESWSPKVDELNTKVHGNVLPVFDVEANGWRSFRWDSVKSVNFSLGE
jgi:hypothetical protein